MDDEKEKLTRNTEGNLYCRKNKRMQREDEKDDEKDDEKEGEKQVKECNKIYRLYSKKKISKSKKESGMMIRNVTN